MPILPFQGAAGAGEVRCHSWLSVGMLGIDTLPGVALQEAASYGVRFPIVADFNGDIQGTALSVTGYPTTFVVSGSGAITRLHGFPYDYGRFEQFADAALAKA